MSHKTCIMGAKTMQFGCCLQSYRCFSRSRSCWNNKSSKVCIVGGGPAGFYATQHLLKALPDAQVDIFERLPVPFGLVRFGVAPDHPEVKNVINTFTKTAQNPRVRFVGNVNLGQDVMLEELMSAYHSVLLTYGAEEDRELGIPGENLGNIVSAREFVGWYNGLPRDRGFTVNLNGETAAILGQGNVALDVARILLTPVDDLRNTDITEYALSALSQSHVKRVLLIGRRGPLQVAFTIKELREMLNLPNCVTKLNPLEFSGVQEIVASLARPRKRLTELMCKAALDNHVEGKSLEGKKIFHPVFLRTPKCFLPQTSGVSTVKGVELVVNKLEGSDLECQRAVATDTIEVAECSLVLRSIGYRSIQSDPRIPFDSSKGLVQNTEGVVEPGLYTAGWLATGPVGVILTTMTNAFAVARTIANDILKGRIDASVVKPGFEAIDTLLTKRGIQTVSFSDWERIDSVEKSRGEEHGKPREKIVDIAEMLNIAAGGSVGQTAVPQQAS